MLTAIAPAHASPWAAPASVSQPSASSEPESPASPESIDAALETGSLDVAQELASEARDAEPSAATWQREGEVLEQSGEYARAARAYREAKQAAGKAAGEDVDASTAAEDGLVRVHAASRGTVADEPVSTHRSELDKRWAPKSKPKPVPEVEPLLDVPPPERIVTKWYFWVTISALVASAAAVTVIAIKAARDDQPDALEALTPGPAPRGFGVLRF